MLGIILVKYGPNRDRGDKDRGQERSQQTEKTRVSDHGNKGVQYYQKTCEVLVFICMAVQGLKRLNLNTTTTTFSVI